MYRSHFIYNDYILDILCLNQVLLSLYEVSYSNSFVSNVSCLIKIQKIKKMFNILMRLVSVQLLLKFHTAAVGIVKMHGYTHYKKFPA